MKIGRRNGGRGNGIGFIIYPPRECESVITREWEKGYDICVNEQNS